jgi:gliding motility-associated-like protein
MVRRYIDYMSKTAFFALLLCLSTTSIFSQTCNNWLQTPVAGAHVSVGDVDVAGSQLTIEAMINRTQSYTGGNLFAGDVVSKHVNPTDANYLLRPNSAEITTDNGYFITPDICEITLNKTYHIAMVYDGSSLKFYRNGFLMSQVAATGNLYQNDFETWIGYYNAQLYNTTFIGYINEVKIWNVAKSQAQLRAGMNVPIPSPTTTPGLLAYYTFNNLLNKQGNASFNGTLAGAAVINTTNPTCAAFIPDSCVTKCIVNEDFSFKVDICDPLTSAFQSTSKTFSYIKWLFGDGSEATGLAAVTYKYANEGVYDVSMILTDGGCTDTITKKITVETKFEDLILTADTTLCPNATKQLRTKPALNFCWFPTTYLNDPASANPTTSTPSNITYYFTGEVIGNNLITNGDFSAGNTGFTSAYNFQSNNITEGEYFVGPNPQAWNVALSTCTDHTTGTGNMMLINGSPAPNVSVWTQTVTVTPNTNYAFSTWIQALWPPNPAQLSFSINGKDIGTTITASLPTCTWTQFYTTWNSGSNTTAIISILNKNTLVQGNDFALDDISFAPVVIRKDSVKIVVEKLVVKTSNDTTVCAGGSVQLSTIGAATYLWTPANNLTSAAIGNPVATPQTNSRYIVTGTSSFGCQAKDTIDIEVFTKTVTSGTNDTLVCNNTSLQLSASGGVSYKWSPAISLSDPLVSNPFAKPAQSTDYVVEIVDANNCQSRDTIRVAVKPYPSFTISRDTNICMGSKVTLVATGGDQYQWSPASTLNNPQLPAPIASPLNSTTYKVFIEENLCSNDTTLSVTVNLSSNPNVTAKKLADIDCSNPTTQLFASGGLKYSWTPAFALDGPEKPNPIVTIDSTTIFVVTGTDANGCSGKDSVWVNVTRGGLPLFVLPNAFTPNNDGKNDCFGIRRWGNVKVQQLSIYNRWGQVVFETNDPAKCWDGRYKGERQPTGGYVYVIKAQSFCGGIVRKGLVMLLH